MNTAVLASIAFPGVGQLMQKRWIAGAAFLCAIAAALCAFLSEVWGIMKAFYGFAFDFLNAPAPDIRLSRLFLTFGAAVFVYVASVLDTITAQARIDRRRRLTRLNPPSLDPIP